MSSQVLGSLSFLDTPDVAGNLVLTTATGLSQGNIAGTTNTITVSGTTNLTIDIASNPILSGVAGFTMPTGTTAQREATPAAGRTRFNSTIGSKETFNGSAWIQDGRVLQVVSGTIPVQTTTVQVPWDNTTPLNTEGVEIWSQVFTPLSATSRIIVMQTLTVSAATAARAITGSIFAGATNIGAGGTWSATTASPYSLALTVTYAPGSTAAITFSSRVGANGSGNCLINQTASGTLGGAAVTEYIIMEVA